MTARHLRLFLVVILIATLLAPSDAFARRYKRKKHRRIYPVATAALLWDGNANRPLYEKNATLRIYPASTTKIMTALLVLEKLPLNKAVTASFASTQVPETKLGIRVNEQYVVSDLLYAILLKSANDAANVLAEAVAGSQENFVTLMNARAKQIGAYNTRFSNAHGLPSATVQYSTAKDMALIMESALKNPVFRRIISYKYRIVYSKDGRRFFLKSHNRSLFLNWKKDVDGKTGYTRQAQSCFVGFMEHQGRLLIVAVFDSRKRWQDVKFIIERYGKIDL